MERKCFQPLQNQFNDEQRWGQKSLLVQLQSFPASQLDVGHA